MDAYDRARGSASGSSRPRRQAGGNTIKGPHSALTDYLQEIGVSEHFRERRQREAEERERQAREQEAAAANVNTGPNATMAAATSAQTADGALAADLQGEEDRAADVGTSSSTRRARTRSQARAAASTTQVTLVAEPEQESEAVAVAVSAEQNEPQAVKAKPKAKRGRKKKNDSEDEADYKEGLNRSSARKGGRMKECELCGKRFLQHKSSVTLYDCTKINRAGIQRIAEECAQVQSLDLEYCGRLDNSGLMTLGSHLRNMTSLRLDGAFLVKDQGWAELFRQHGPRLTSFKVRFTGFGIDATRALVIHCPNLVELRISECVDFDDDCLALLSVPITDYEEEKQEYERVVRLLADRNKKGKHSVAVQPKDYSGPIPGWKPLSSLVKLDLAYPYKPMTSQTTARMIRTLGSQLSVLDLSGFKDIDDSVVLGALDEHGQKLEELYLSECMGISPEAMCEFFARQRKKAKVPGMGYRRVGLKRCYMLTDSVIRELVLHSGATLKWLDLNSVDDNLSSLGLRALEGAMYRRETVDGKETHVLAEQTSGCVNLEELDLSWVRCTTDSVLEDILKRCKKLERISVYGCPEVTAFAPRRPGLKYIGRGCDSL
ncbi:UV-damaged DNA-binding protein rad7 [Coemansia interrupta]|uniref:UV-damaged DNA-binding protein rad7 n=1 Tax=Coemansia interrupta TaxID=1126814 RepID=A0A9W8LEX3_9FUNG|nr:UV-damaged DNA-binding protein rad7 [Coemansia interrupta]